MYIKPPNSISLFRFILLVTVITTFLALFVGWQELQKANVHIFQSKWIILIAGLVCLVSLGMVGFLLTWNKKTCQGLVRFYGHPSLSFGYIKVALFLLFVLLLVFYTFFYTSSLVKNFQIFNESVFRLWMFWICGVAAGLVLKAGSRRIPLGTALMAGFISEAVVSMVGSSLLIISTNPFTLSWEEQYRLYYASLLASERLYAMQLPLSPVNFSLNLLNGIPFLLGDFPIWVHRLWRVCLVLGMAALTGWAIIRRLKIENRLWRVLLVGFLMLFLLQQGGVKYYLLVSVIIILSGLYTRHPWRSLISVVLASIWAGLSRVNWIPVPAMLAVALYLLENPVRRDAGFFRYALWPVIWAVAGLAAAVLANQAIPIISGSEPFVVESLLHSPLLWYRLFPNSTFPMGILPGILLLSIPLWWIYLRCINTIHPIRWVGITLICLVSLAGGLVASVKIGGGSDLHNLDAHIVMLGLVASYFVFQRAYIDENGSGRSVPWQLIILAMIFPLWSTLTSVKPYVGYNPVEVDAALQLLRTDVEPASAHGEVLFMHQKHLLAFGYIDVPLVPEYENVFVMEMAMTHNKEYLENFKTDLCQHRFSLIVSEYQPSGLQGRTHVFGEENDAWYEEVTLPLLTYYQLDSRIPYAGLELYKFRSDSVNCLLDGKSE